MAPFARVRIRIRVLRDRAWHAQLIAPMLGISAAALARQLRLGSAVFGPFSASNAEALAKALRCFGVVCTLERPASRLGELPTLRGTANSAGRYVRRFVKRPTRRSA